MRGRTAESLEQLTTTTADSSPVFFFRGEGFSAKMLISQSGDFVVKAGSKARARTTPTIPKGTLVLRETLLKSGVLRADASMLVFASNYSFTSASAAAATVNAAQSSGLSTESGDSFVDFSPRKSGGRRAKRIRIGGIHEASQ